MPRFASLVVQVLLIVAFWNNNQYYTMIYKKPFNRLQYEAPGVTSVEVGVQNPLATSDPEIIIDPIVDEEQDW